MTWIKNESLWYLRKYSNLNKVSPSHVVGTILTRDDRRSFIWRDGQISIHSSGKGLYLTNAINDHGLVIGATLDKRFEAATMKSNAVVEVATKVSTKLNPLAAFSILVAIAAVIWRRRYRGIQLDGKNALPY